MSEVQNQNQNENVNKNIQVHTMAEDLKELEHPQKTEPRTSKPNVAEKVSQSKPAQLTEEQKNNPFLNPDFKISPLAPQKDSATLTETTKESAKPVATPNIHDVKSNKSAPTPAKNASHSANKILFAAIIAIIILIIGAGTYYFIATKKQPAQTTQNTASNQNQQQTSDQNQASPQPQNNTQDQSHNNAPTADSNSAVYSATNPNYMNIDIANADGVAIKNTIDQYAHNVSASKATAPIEFSVVDLQNNPISFSTFAKKIGLDLSSAVMSDLGDDFSLYIYNDQSNTRLGLIVSAKNPTGLKTALLTEEKTLPSDLQALFLDSDYSINSGKVFASSAYDGADVRYENIVSPEDLSVDYTVFNNSLMIGTTEMTLRAMIDKISSANIQTNQDNTSASMPSSSANQAGATSNTTTTTTNTDSTSAISTN